MDALARPGELCLLAGDFNVKAVRSRSLADLSGPEWGFSQPGEGIDQILVRGADGQVERWPPERRRVGGRLLSDHTPIELRVR